MTSTFYINNSDNRVVNKQLIPVINNVDIVFKSDTDIYKPTLIISNINSIENANYLYIEDLDRYYYINEKEQSQQMIYLYCITDVLMTYSNYIKELYGTIRRQSNIFDTYLKDNEFLVEGYSRVQTMNFPYGLNNQECYLLMTNGSSIIENGGDENVG